MSREPSPAPIEAVPGPTLSRSNRPSRACTLRAAERLKAAAAASAVSEPRRAKSSSKRKRNRASENGNRGDEDLGEEEDEEEEEFTGDCDGEESPAKKCGKIVTSLVSPPPEAQLPRWNLRSMWELASVLNFLHVFRPLLNISAEFSAEEFETALITPNDNLSDIHIPLLKAIPPVTRMALTRDTWVTVLCRKLRDWWHWVADGDLPIVAAHGAEIEAYKTLDPGVRVVILKALCDIRVEQEDIRNYIDNSLKHGVRLSTFRKERVGGDSHGISYWYEDDSLVGHRLYREIRKFELKRAKIKGSNVALAATYQWETVATNFDEFEDVSEKLFTSKNRTEASLGKKLKNDMLPEIEKVHKRKEKLLKKQHRQALLLDNFYPVDGIGPGRSLRDRKPVTYTFDDYDRSINEAIKITKKKPPSPESLYRRDDLEKPEASSNGKWSPSYAENNFSALSPKSPDYNEADDEDVDDDDNDESLDRGNRRRQRPQRYSEKDFVEAISDNDADFDSDDDIVGEAVYDEEYLRKRKQRRKLSSSSEGDEEYHWDDENAEEEEEEEDEEEEFLSGSDDSDESPKFKKLWGSSTKLRSVGDLQSGLRRSKRSTRNRINYQQYEISDSEGEAKKLKISNALEENSDESENGIEDEHENENENENGNGGFSMESPVSDANEDDTLEIPVGQSVVEYPRTVEKEESTPTLEKSNSPGQEEIDGVRERRFLDLNEIAPGDLNEAAPGSSFDDAQNNAVMKDDDTGEF